MRIRSEGSVSARDSGSSWLQAMELLKHVNTRVKSRHDIKLPVEQLLVDFHEPAMTSLSKNFGLIYIEMGFPRLTPDDAVALFPSLLQATSRRDWRALHDAAQHSPPLAKACLRGRVWRPWALATQRRSSRHGSSRSRALKKNRPCAQPSCAGQRLPYVFLGGVSDGGNLPLRLFGQFPPRVAVLSGFSTHAQTCAPGRMPMPNSGTHSAGGGQPSGVFGFAMP